MKRTRKIFALLLSICMIVTMLPTVAFAAEPTTVTDENTLTATLTSVDDGGTVKLDNDITVTKSLSVTKSITLDLNGHKLSGSVANLILINNRAGEKTITLKIVDNSQDGTKGSIEAVNAAPAIAVVAKNSTIKAEVELDNGISITGSPVSVGSVINISTFSTLTVKNAVVTANGDGAKAINVDSTSSLDITDGVFSGTISVAGASSNANPTRSIKGGYFSDFSASVANNIPAGFGLLGIEPEESDHAGMYKVGQINDDVKNSAEAKVKLGTEETTYVYGTLQQLFDLYKGRGKEFEILKDATLTLEGYGSANAGVFNDANTLKFKIDSGKTLTLNATDTKTAKFEFAGEGFYTKNVKPASGYSIKESSNAMICDIDPTSNAIIAVATVDGNPRYLTAGNIEAFLSNTKDAAKGVTAITFKQDYTLKQAIDIPANSNVTIDLGGHTITSNIAEGAALRSINGGKVTLKNGTLDASLSGIAITLGVTGSNSEPGQPVKPDTTSKGEAVIEDGAVIKGTISVFNDGSKLTMEKGSSVEADGFAIAGNGAHDGTEITIKNGASVTSKNTAAIYHPQDGKLTIGEVGSKETTPAITGKAGVVARAGKVEMNNGTITATGTEDLVIGDAKDEDGNPIKVPAGGIVYDNSTGYSATGEQGVDIKDGAVKAAEGQPSVTYTENGEDAIEGGEGEPSVKLSGGTFMTGNKGDLNASQYVEAKNGVYDVVDPRTGALVEPDDADLAIVQVGYSKTAVDAYAQAARFRPDWTDDKPTTKDWGGQTMWVTFNKAIPNGTYYWLEVTAPDGQKYGIRCKGDGTSRTFAMSFLNEDQWESWPSNVKPGIHRTGTYTVDVYTDGVTSTTTSTPTGTTPKFNEKVEVILDAAIKDIAITDVGFKANADDAKAGIVKAVQANGRKDVTSFNNDVSANTMWVAFTAKDKDNAHKVDLEITCGSKTYSETFGGTPNGYLANKNEGIFYVSLDKQLKASAFGAGEYTFTLKIDNVVVDTETLKIYEVKLDPRGGTLNGSSDVVSRGFCAKEDIVSPTDIPTLAGSKFKGWGSPTTDENTYSVTYQASWTPIAIESVGFKAKSADAKKAIEDGLEPEKTVNDVSDNTMYVVLNDRVDNQFTVKVTKGTEEIYTETVNDAKVIYFRFTETGDQNMGKPGDSIATVGTADAPGKYTAKLYVNDVEYSSDELDLYKVIYDAGAGTFADGKQTFDAGLAMEADAGKLDKPANPTRAGYDFNDYVSSVDTDNHTITYTAQWKSKGGGGGGGSVTTYPVTKPASPTNGSVDVSSSRASAGSNVTITPKPADGYEVDKVTVTNKKTGEAVAVTKNSDGTYTFKMPASEVTIDVTFKEKTTEPQEDTVCKPYTDVVTSGSDGWYHEFVHYMIEKGFMTGTAENQFAPNMNLNRAMVAQILYAKADKPTVAATTKFSDVPAGEWYTSAVSWAVENGAVTGYTDGTFKPLQDVTRQELAVMLYGKEGKPTVSGNELAAFTDSAEIADWAQNAMLWAVQNGIMTGDTNKALTPTATATRAQASAMLYRCFTK